MKKRIIILIFISMNFISCLKDSESLKKEKLFLFYDKMKEAIINDDKNWIKKNSINKITNNYEMKNFFSFDRSEYSVTINYNIKPSDIRDAVFIIRNSSLSPNYYYIKLKLNNKKNKWLVESIDKLPVS